MTLLGAFCLRRGMFRKSRLRVLRCLFPGGAPRAHTFLGFSGSGASRAAIADLVGDVDAGGYVAKRALQTLVALTRDSDAKAAMVSAGVLHSAVVLLRRPSSDESLRGWAGSLVSLLTDAPVAAELSDDVSGGDGRVEVVLPRPSRVYAQ